MVVDFQPDVLFVSLVSIWALYNENTVAVRKVHALKVRRVEGNEPTASRVKLISGV
jgi:hypothetical protein